MPSIRIVAPYDRFNRLELRDRANGEHKPPLHVHCLVLPLDFLSTQGVSVVVKAHRLNEPHNHGQAITANQQSKSPVDLIRGANINTHFGKNQYDVFRARLVGRVFRVTALLVQNNVVVHQDSIRVGIQKRWPGNKPLLQSPESPHAPRQGKVTEPPGSGATSRGAKYGDAWIEIDCPYDGDDNVGAGSREFTACGFWDDGIASNAYGRVLLNNVDHPGTPDATPVLGYDWSIRFTDIPAELCGDWVSLKCSKTSTSQVADENAILIP